MTAPLTEPRADANPPIAPNSLGRSRPSGAAARHNATKHTWETTLTLIGQITGRKPPTIFGTAFELGPLGYSEAEYSLSGTADAYQRDGAGVKVAERAEFSTRLLVRRPADPAAVNGTVWVEWLNVR